ncbi:aminoglycoside phosphotransferase family protein [Rummeliibacillus sp. NPDC094406]|uniref:aminoglycoside phosphotransferase family protein n=1 Tax=Rummeliibacillus sp. NPDC094406 TaxID=3364511 RepID=UPI003803C45C
MNLGNPISKGNTAEIYRFDNKIVKLLKEYLPYTESLYEAKKQEFAYSCGLDVPKIHEITEFNGRQAIVMEYIKGQTVGELILNNMELAERYFNIFANAQMNMHNIVVESGLLESMSEKLKRQIISGRILNEFQKSEILKRLDSMNFESRLCHGDYHPFNLILNNDKVTIIDWVDSSAGDIRADVYRSYLLISQSSLELAELYLGAYCQKSKLSREEVFQWAPIIVGARLSENVSSENIGRLKKIINEYVY